MATFSLVLAARSAVGVLGPILAWVADQQGRKVGMLFGLLLFTFGTGLVVFWPPFPGLVVALILTALGKIVIDPAIQAYLGDHVPYQRRGLAIGIAEMGWSLSFVAGVPLMGFLIARGGWLAPFPILALLGFISMGVLVWLLKESITSANQQNIWEIFRSIFASVPAISGLMVGFLSSTVNEMVNLIFGVWLEDTFSLQIAALGAASLLIGVSEMAGESLVGGFTDRWGKKRAIAGGLPLNVLAALALPVFGRTLPGALVGLFLFYVTFEFSIVSSVSMMTELMPTARASFLAVNVAGLSLGRALAALIAPQVFMGGIFVSVVTVFAFNLFALLALRWVVVPQEA